MHGAIICITDVKRVVHVAESNGAISRVLAGQLVGFAYGGLGPAWV